MKRNGIELYRLMMRGEGVPGLEQDEKIIIKDGVVEIVTTYKKTTGNRKLDMYEIENMISENGRPYLPTGM